MRAVPFFRYNYVEAVRSTSIPNAFSPSIEFIERTKPGENRRPRSISPRREIDELNSPIETKEKSGNESIYIYISIVRANHFFLSSGIALSIFRVSSRTWIVIDVAPIISISRVPISAHAPTPRYKGYADKGNKQARDRSDGGSLINRIQLAARENKRSFPFLETDRFLPSRSIIILSPEKRQPWRADTSFPSFRARLAGAIFTLSRGKIVTRLQPGCRDQFRAGAD